MAGWGCIGRKGQYRCRRTPSSRSVHCCRPPGPILCIAHVPHIGMVRGMSTRQACCIQELFAIVRVALCFAAPGSVLCDDLVQNKTKQFDTVFILRRLTCISPSSQYHFWGMHRARAQLASSTNISTIMRTTRSAVGGKASGVASTGGPV